MHFMFFCVMKMCDLKSFSYVMIKTLLVFIHFQKFLMFYFRKLNRGDSLEMQIYFSRAENDSKNYMGTFDIKVSCGECLC